MNSLNGKINAPGDKSISHRAVLMALLADGKSIAHNWLNSKDTQRSLEAVNMLGADTDFQNGTATISKGLFPDEIMAAIDCGNSGTTARLLCGLVAGSTARATLFGDDSLSNRPMSRVIKPLQKLGAEINGGPTLPMTVSGVVQSGKVEMEIASAQVKSALLLTGKDIELTNCGGSRDHTERLLKLMGADIKWDEDSVQLKQSKLRPFEITVPGDPSSAAFFLCASVMTPGSKVTVENMLLNETRIGFIRVLESMGAKLEITVTDDSWEPIGNVTASYSELKPFSITAQQIPSLIDELPILALVATQADGVSTVSGAQELRVKESDRIQTTVQAITKLGGNIKATEDGFVIDGSTIITPTEEVLVTNGDHRLAMMLSIAGQTALDDIACVDVSFPDFYKTLESLK
ncbi:3-phosphoshikimate 1-carboxyvinyltransferase [bacterium]|jgi:3-phosphoshikimate 1-carboxyvinyltransferase|nr:3-phosphoshikimate 1-carboxyvinyltransferase [bacterium]